MSYGGGEYRAKPVLIGCSVFQCHWWDGLRETWINAVKVSIEQAFVCEVGKPWPIAEVVVHDIPSFLGVISDCVEVDHILQFRKEFDERKE